MFYVYLYTTTCFFTIYLLETNTKKVQMGHMSCITICRGYRRRRGFRLHSKISFVQRVRTKLFKFFRFLVRSWRTYCSSSSSSYAKCESRRFDKAKDWSSPRRSSIEAGRLKSFGRSNSFYAEAIADCLEFMKKSSVSLDDKIDI